MAHVVPVARSRETVTALSAEGDFCNTGKGKRVSERGRGEPGQLSQEGQD